MPNVPPLTPSCRGNMPKSKKKFAEPTETGLTKAEASAVLDAICYSGDREEIDDIEQHNPDLGQAMRKLVTIAEW